MSNLPQNFREKEGTSPFREKWLNRTPSKLSTSESSNIPKENTPQRARQLYGIQNRDFSGNQPSSSKVSNTPSHDFQEYEKKA